MCVTTALHPFAKSPLTQVVGNTLPLIDHEKGQRTFHAHIPPGEFGEVGGISPLEGSIRVPPNSARRITGIATFFTRHDGDPATWEVHQPPA